MYNGHLSIEEVDELSQQKGPAENQTHVENCQQCRLLLDKYKAVSAKLERLMSARIGARNGMNCPDEKVWFDVAARNLPDTEGAKYVQHASECDSCGKKLATAMRLFQEDLTKEEEQALAELPGATPTAQRKLAERLAGSTASTTEPPPEKRKRSIWWPLSFSLAGAAVVVAVSFFAVPVLISRNSPAEAQKLLAEAYTENRTIEMRIPGAKHAEIRQQRSGDSGSILNTSEAARKAQDKISSGLKKDSDSPEWLILQAQLDLLDWRYKAADSALNKVETGTERTGFLLTRALALNEQGEIEHNPQVRGEAIDLLGRVLQKDPNNPTALFNQAVVCEALYIYECASKDWQQLLGIEKDPGWAAEARDHLKRIQEKKTLGP